MKRSKSSEEQIVYAIRIIVRLLTNLSGFALPQTALGQNLFGPRRGNIGNFVLVIAFSYSIVLIGARFVLINS